MPKTSAAKMSLLIFIAESHDMHPNGVPCSKRRGWDSYKSLAFRVMGALAQSSQVSKNALWLCHPERNASEVEGSSDSVKMRCELNARRLGVPLPTGKVGLYSRGNRLRYARRSPPRTEPCLRKSPPHRGHYP